MISNRNKIIEWLYNNDILDYVIDDNMVVSVNSSVKLMVNGGDGYIPIQFGVVGGNFDCSGVKLESLKGSPVEVGGDFICDYNFLESLMYSPERVFGNFSFYSSNLLS